MWTLLSWVGASILNLNSGRTNCSRRFVEATTRPCCRQSTAAEVEQAPDKVKAVHIELIEGGAELLPVSAESMDLLNKYLDRKILGPKFHNDMLHIALATIADADVLVSWNFRHIVRLGKIRLFNSVNIECGYKPSKPFSERVPASIPDK